MINEWYNVPFYRFICYCLSGWYTGIYCYLKGAYFTFDTGVGDIKDTPTTRKFQELWAFTLFFGVSRVCDRWRRVEDRSFKDGGHQELVGKAY